VLLLLVGCGDKAKDLHDTAQLKEKQNNMAARSARQSRARNCRVEFQKLSVRD